MRENWLGLTGEAILDPGLPIVDPHHHLWERDGGHSYLLPQLLADTASGHDIRATIFVQCGEMYRASGPAEEQPLGETEFVTGAAAVSASGRHGPTRACAGIIGMVDLTLGDKVEALLEKHRAIAGGRFCGIRNRNRLAFVAGRHVEPGDEAAGTAGASVLRRRRAAARRSRACRSMSGAVTRSLRTW